jgi:hydroxymethylpyrimidine/phosphomethylpyrimidine kinase
MSHPDPTDTGEPSPHPACVLVFNANDPSGAGGLACDATAMASIGTHTLPVVTGAYVRDTSDILDHIAFDEEAVTDQARALLEDVPVQIIKVGFVGTPENLGAIAAIASDYPDLPLIAYMPDLSWWSEVQIDLYQDAFRELLLPQTAVLVGNYSTLRRWLLPDWEAERAPTARDIARAAAEAGAAYTLVTGMAAPEQFIDNVLATPETVLGSQKFEHFDVTFTGAGDTLSAALTALLASGLDLTDAFAEALNYLDNSLSDGFRPGMGHVIPDRLFWAQLEDEADAASPDPTDPTTPSFELPPHDTKH